MFHVEPMSSKNRLFVKDRLVSGEFFEILWNQKKERGETQLPPATELSAYYKSSQYASHKTEKKTFIDRVYFAVQRRMFGYKAKLIRQYVSGKTLLDYGAGTGRFGQYMASIAYAVSLIEPNDNARKFASIQTLDTYTSLEDLPKDHYHIITLWHVLEHLPDPEAALNNLKQYLDKQGVMVVAVPNFNSYDSIYYKEDWAALDVPRHLWHFTSPGIRLLFENSGFKLTGQHPLWFDAFYIAYLSEQYKKRSFPLIRGLFIGLISNIKAWQNGEYSSVVYVFTKNSSAEED